MSEKNMELTETPAAGRVEEDADLQTTKYLSLKNNTAPTRHHRISYAG